MKDAIYTIKLSLQEPGCRSIFQSAIEADTTILTRRRQKFPTAGSPHL